jgi:hypothetical protein
MNKQEKEAVLKMRKKGLWRFILDRGVMRVGVLTALLVLIWKSYDGQPLAWDQVKVLVLIHVCFTGPIWALTMWWWMGRKLDQEGNSQ